MDTEIIEKKKVPLFGRTDLTVRLTFKGATPDNESVKQSVASKMKVDKKLVTIKTISTDYGFSGARVSAEVYDNQQALDTYSPKLGKKAIEKMKKAEEAAKKPEKQPAETPKEEKAEEKPAETPKKEKAEEKPAEKGE